MTIWYMRSSSYG